MKYSSLLLLLLTTLPSLIAQVDFGDYYNQWVFGYDYLPDQGYGLNMLDFNNSEVELSHYDVPGLYFLVASDPSGYRVIKKIIIN